MSKLILVAAGLVLLLPFSAATAADPVAAVEPDPAVAIAERELAARDAADADRYCLKETGSRIRPQNGECVNGAGRSYSREDVENSGALTAADALRRLDARF